MTWNFLCVHLIHVTQSATDHMVKQLAKEQTGTGEESAESRWLFHQERAHLMMDIAMQGVATV